VGFGEGDANCGCGSRFMIFVMILNSIIERLRLRLMGFMGWRRLLMVLLSLMGSKCSTTLETICALVVKSPKNR
jgi:hypothetical protein